MNKTILKVIFVFGVSCLFAACAAHRAHMVVNSDTVPPGSQVARKGLPLSLIGTPISLGQRMPLTHLVDARTMSGVDLDRFRGKVLLLSIVPSVDTKVCEAQTHYLGEEGDQLPKNVVRMTISRDTPFAQTRFAKEAKLTDIQYLSDYKAGDFGRATGLLMNGPMLLARSIILVDQRGIVQYIQVVPEITHLPDMEKAFAKAVDLAKQTGGSL
ncbi:MAG: peroxiredoxin [Nitrospiria bacterium]